MILFVYLEYKSNKCETKTFLCNAYFLPKNLVGTNRGQSGSIKDSWCFLKKISVRYCPTVLYRIKTVTVKIAPAFPFERKCWLVGHWHVSNRGEIFNAKSPSIPLWLKILIIYFIGFSADIFFSF